MQFIIFLFLLLIPVVDVSAGNLDSSAPPTDAGSAMFTIDDIYNRFNSGASGSKRSGPFAEPAAAPGSTGHTLDEVMSKAPAVDNTNGAGLTHVLSGKKFWGLTSSQWGFSTGTGTVSSANPAPVEKTGQTTSYASGDDGALQKGAAWASPRFTDKGDGTIIDNNTGLIWLKNANCFNSQTWTNALSSCNNLASGSCGLADGSTAGDWRLPNWKELQSLIDYGRYNPALPSGHPFSGVQSYVYWSSSTYASNTSVAWVVSFNFGYVNSVDKTGSPYVLPVRGGQ